jgi:geranylgeranyl pyrophosphate synthase
MFGFDEIQTTIKQTKEILGDLLSRLPSYASSRLTDFILGGSGKMIRPLLTIQTIKLLGGTSEHIQLGFLSGAIIEILHNTSLIHDDIIDGATKRRGRETYHEKYGYKRALSDGDLLWAFILTEAHHFEKDLILYLLNTVYTVNKGNSKELEIRFERNYDFTYNDIIEIMQMKTGIVFYACINGACKIIGRNQLGKSLESCLINAGIAFQLQDDILDIQTNQAVFGKEDYWDIQESKPTLFLYYALQTPHASKIREVYSKPVGDKSSDDINYVTNIYKGLIDQVIIEKEKFMNLANEHLKTLIETTSDQLDQQFLRQVQTTIQLLGNRKK